MRWIKIYKNIFSTPVADDAETLRIYLYLASNAAYRTMHVRNVVIQHGQLLTSSRELSESLARNRRTIDKILDKLVEMEYITIVDMGNKGILITIAYDETIASAPADTPADAPASAPARAPQNRIEKEIYKEKEITVVSTTVDTHPQKPTIDEIQQYITDKGYTDIDAEAFWNFYESKNWMIGKNKMSKWKSAIATWHRKNLIEQKQKQNIKHTDNDTNQIDSQNRRLQDALLSTYYSMLGSQEAPRNEGLPDVPDILLG